MKNLTIICALWTILVIFLTWYFTHKSCVLFPQVHSREMDSLKRLISDNSKQSKFDTIIIQGRDSIEKIKIVYKTKQNEAKNDTLRSDVVASYLKYLELNKKREE